MFTTFVLHKKKIKEAENRIKFAEKEKEKLNQFFLEYLITAVGSDDFLISTEPCFAEGIATHIYTPNTKEIGYGKRTCVCCGEKDLYVDDDENK